MSTQSQIAANQANAQHSTGPKTEEGKANSSRNNFRHGLAGLFVVMAWESQLEFDQLNDHLFAEHEPVTPTETLLVESMVQHYWLAQRAMRLQRYCFQSDVPYCDREKELALYLRYQATHDRAFHKALNQLLKLRADNYKAKIGFELHHHKRNEESRRAARESRRQELHKMALWLAEAKVDHQHILTGNARLTQIKAKIAGIDIQKDAQTVEHAA